MQAVKWVRAWIRDLQLDSYFSRFVFYLLSAFSQISQCGHVNLTILDSSWTGAFGRKKRRRQAGSKTMRMVTNTLWPWVRTTWRACVKS